LHGRSDGAGNLQPDRIRMPATPIGKGRQFTATFLSRDKQA
jgi:hypothetical protein